MRRQMHPGLVRCKTPSQFQTPVEIRSVGRHKDGLPLWGRKESATRLPKDSAACWKHAAMFQIPEGRQRLDHGWNTDSTWIYASRAVGRSSPHGSDGCSIRGGIRKLFCGGAESAVAAAFFGEGYFARAVTSSMISGSRMGIVLRTLAPRSTFWKSTTRMRRLWKVWK
jgi:hypothetical protein